METHLQVARFLFTYHLIPHATTGCCPPELLLGQKPCSALDAIHPDLEGEMARSQQHQEAHDQLAVPAWCDRVSLKLEWVTVMDCWCGEQAYRPVISGFGS